MSDLGEAVFKLGSLFTGIIEVYIWVVIISALLSFVKPDPFNPVVQFLYRITNPTYSFVKSITKTNFGGLDLAPLMIIIGLQVVVIIINLLFATIAKAI